MLERSSISHLPVETLIHAMSFLEPRDLAQTERVSRFWQEASNCEILWRRQCEAKYGHSYLASVAYPHPKAAFLLPIYIKSFHHVLKPLPLQLSKSWSFKMELHGQYLIQRNKISVKDPCSKISECPLIYDLIRQEQIAIPNFFDEAPFIKWTVCNKKQAVVVQDKEGRLIYSEPPFETQITHHKFEGSVLNVAGNNIFYTSNDKKELSVFNLYEGKTSFTMCLDTPIQSFFASEHAHAAILEDNVIIFNDPSDLSKNFKVSFDRKQFYPHVLSNRNWLIIVGTGYEKTTFFHACNLITGKFYPNLFLHIDDGRLILDPCTGLELCNNHLFVSVYNTFAFNLETLEKENRCSSDDITFCEFPCPLSSFGNQFFFFVDSYKEEGVYFTDTAATKLRNKMNLDIYLKDKMFLEAVTNGRFIVVIQGSDRLVRYCDLLAPERSSSKHFISVDDKRVRKRKKD